MRPCRLPTPAMAPWLPLLLVLGCGGGEAAPGVGAEGSGDEGGAPAAGEVAPERPEAEAPGDRPTGTPGAGPDGAGLPTGAGRLLEALFVPGGPRALLSPCGTDRVLTVEGPRAAAELERRVRLERPGVDGPVRLTVRGAAGEGVFRLDEVVRIHRADDCPEAPADRPLEGTAWQLSGLPDADEAVRRAGAWLRLDGETGAVEGSTGCRALAGRYDWNVTRLRFAGLDARVAACPGAALHRALLDALARTGSYRIEADTLVLLGEAGPVATFRAPER